MNAVTDTIVKALTRAMEGNGWLSGPVPDFEVVHPKDEQHGDYTTNLALMLAKTLGQNPRAVAEKLITSLRIDTELNSLIERVEVAGAGFINFYAKPAWLAEQVGKAAEKLYGRNTKLSGKRVMVEYTDPNPFKEFHIGHLMSNTIGESLARLMEEQGAEVKRACYQGDVGLHVAKAIWGMREQLKADGKALADIGKLGLQERQKFMGAAYARGAQAYEEDGAAKAEMHKLNEQIYKRSDDGINALYDAGRKWSLEYFETIYARLGTKFDEYFFESEAGKVGLEVVEEAVQKGVLVVGEEGAIVYKGEAEGLHTRVFRNKLGLPTYEAKDLGLAKTKYGRYPYDQSYIVTANEITEYFKVVLSVMGKLYPELAAKTMHLPHGVMKLPTGKMSSRTGKVVTGETLLDELKRVVLEKMGERNVADKDMVADEIAVGALKYTVLKQAVGGDIVYEPEKMTNLEGETGPYLQYTYARAKSVLRKAKAPMQSGSSHPTLSNKEETALVKWLYRFPEVIEEAGRKYAPHTVAGYLYELSQRFNTFYNQHQILGDEFRLELTTAVAKVMQRGLWILGIAAPEEM